MQLALLSGEQSLLAGPVTVVGKVVRPVRKPGQEYIDDASLATFSGPTRRIDAVGLQGDGPEWVASSPRTRSCSPPAA